MNIGDAAKQGKYEQEEDDDDLDLASIKVLKDEDSNTVNINTSSISNLKEDDDLFYLDDDNIEYEIENGIKSPEVNCASSQENGNGEEEDTVLSFDSILVNHNNNDSATQSSVVSSVSTENSYCFETAGSGSGGSQTQKQRLNRRPNGRSSVKLPS